MSAAVAHYCFYGFFISGDRPGGGERGVEGASERHLQQPRPFLLLSPTAAAATLFTVVLRVACPPIHFHYY